MRASIAVIAIVVVLTVIGFVVLPGKSMDVLQPAGTISSQQLNLMIFTVGLTMTVVIPVFILLFYMAWKYREDNPKKQTYKPDDDGNRAIEIVWWGIPFAIITILGVTTWISTHELDPYKPIASSQPTLEVQVISLDWKWLFIYPEQAVASVNELYIPVDRPVHFTMAGDSPMSAMWIPKLGSQVYAMKGMSTQLNLMASEEGVYHGSNSNISGAGYADMYFKVHAVKQGEWNKWISEAEKSPQLDSESYEKLARPSRGDTPKQYALASPDLYDSVVMKYMGHGGIGVDSAKTSHDTHGGSH